MLLLHFWWSLVERMSLGANTPGVSSYRSIDEANLTPRPSPFLLEPLWSGMKGLPPDSEVPGVSCGARSCRPLLCPLYTCHSWASTCETVLPGPDPATPSHRQSLHIQGFDLIDDLDILLHRGASMKGSPLPQALMARVSVLWVRESSVHVMVMHRVFVKDLAAS
jgi:hypothetical protein